MNVHIVPHGRTTAHIKKGLRAKGPADRVYLLTSEIYEETGISLAAELEEFGYTTEQRLVDAFDLRDVVDTIVTIAQQHTDADLYVNITGGTNLMAGAATSSAFFIGARPYYILEQQDDEPLNELVRELPAPTQPLHFDLSNAQLEVFTQLGRWDAEGRTGVIGREVADKLGASPQKISYHINELEQKRLIETENDGRRKEIHVTESGKLYLRWTGEL